MKKEQKKLERIKGDLFRELSQTEMELVFGSSELSFKECGDGWIDVDQVE